MNEFEQILIAARLEKAGYWLREFDWFLELHSLLSTPEAPVNQFALLAVVLKNPKLFSQTPETLNDNVERSAALLGVTKRQIIAAVLKNPKLFGQTPEALNSKKPYIIKINEALGAAKDFVSLLETYPTTLTNSRNHLHLRYIIAKLGLKRGAFGRIALMSAAKANKLILDHFTDQIERNGIGTRTLQVIHAQGLIPILPVGITRIERYRNRPSATP